MSDNAKETLSGIVSGSTAGSNVAGGLLSVAELRSTEPAERVIDAPEVAGAGALLAIDTALGTSVALGAHGRVYEAVSDDAMRHAEVIGTLIARVFESANITPESVRGVVVGVGPGPFTGLRVGIAAAHAFARGREVPLLPLHGHEAVALAVLETGAAHGVRVVQDARRRELFTTAYGGLDWAGIPERQGEPTLIARTNFVEQFGDVWPARIPTARLVQLAARRLATARDFEADRAVYLREPDVRPPSAPKRVVP